ncbi:hypothetical protein yrohd0001_33670 [Yersinia rohdei ATCC 43380]|nr:hypothetical protein yrohd0001_33670 [Yersinia rohdei ATCC 43380]
MPLNLLAILFYSQFSTDSRNIFAGIDNNNSLTVQHKEEPR